MIISKGRAYVFVHMPKTGGTSMALALEGRAMADDILIGDTPKAKKRKRRLATLNPAGRLWKHATLADIDGVVSPSELEEMFTFTLVRNPWDRLVSYYCWLKAQNFDHPDVGYAQTLDFESFVKVPSVQSSFSGNPSRRYMTDAEGAERCNAYIRLEHFEQDAKPLFDHLGFTLELPRTNRSKRDADYSQYYTSTAKDIVGEMCAEDIARFDYRFVSAGV